MTPENKTYFDEIAKTLPASVLTTSQKKTFRKEYIEDGQRFEITVTIHHDDECKNGHNSFAMTANIYQLTGQYRGFYAGGCQHDKIAKHFPKLKKYIKWHLTGTNSPVHYIANTVYNASDRDCCGKRKGEPSSFETRIKFGDSPVTHAINKKFADWLLEKSTDELKTLEIVPIEYQRRHLDNYNFGPKYTFKGFNDKWYDCPFDSLAVAKEWQEAFKTTTFNIIKIITGYSDGKERDFDAARASAVWPDAPDEILMSAPPVLERLLIDRLPALMAEFKKDVEELGFTY